VGPLLELEIFRDLIDRPLDLAASMPPMPLC